MIIKNRGREGHPHRFIGLYLLTHKVHCANNFLVIVWVGVCPRQMTGAKMTESQRPELYP